ncbi:MAG: TAXI family TRAP transporter solute-binding subunit [Methyloligellaceae bacterium]
MKVLRKIFWLGCLALAVVTMPIGNSANAADLTLTAGSPGGGYFKAAAAFAEYIKAEIPGTNTTVIPGGGWANVERLTPESKLADVAVVENALSTLAWKGESPTGKKYDFRMLASFRGPSVAQAVITKSAGVKTFEEIAAKKMPIRIVTFERSQLVTPIALDILAGYGITEEKLKSWGGKIVFTSQGEGIRMILDGLADMWITGGSFFPHHKYIQLGTKKPFRLLPMSKAVAEKVAAKYGAELFQVPADIYKDANGESGSYWSPMLIIDFAVRTELPDDLVYKMTAALAKHKDEFWQIHKQHKFYKPEVAWKNVGSAPLHPGAEKWYKEQGHMK